MKTEIDVLIEIQKLEEKLKRHDGNIDFATSRMFDWGRVKHKLQGKIESLKWSISE